MSKSTKKNAKSNQNNKGYQDQTKTRAADSVQRSDNGSHAENKSDKSYQ